MRQNVIFSFVFIAIIVGLVQLHKYSVEKEGKDQSEVSSPVNNLTIKDIAFVTNLAGLEERSDIPFVKLVDPELRKTLPEDTNYEQYRPDKILLKERFNADDPDQVKEFSSIIFSLTQMSDIENHIITYENDLSTLNEYVSQYVKNNAEQMSAIISDWKASSLVDHNNAKQISFEYKQTCSSGKAMYNIISFIYKGDYQLQVVLAATPSDYLKWIKKYNLILNSIDIK